jgi:5'-methylthioadenosine phosphorylase
MTNVPEAFLAVEAQLGYATIAVATDYDCWLEDPSQHVSVDQVMALFQKKLGEVQRLIAASVAEYVEDESRPCRQALRNAIITPREQMTDEQRGMVDFLMT